MSYRRTIVVAVFLVAALSLQTTLFGQLRPLDAAPALVILTVIALARHLSPEGALITGFLAGFFEDLLADSVLGLWALTLLVVAFVVIKIRRRLVEDFTLLGPAVFIVSFGALALFAVLSTIFGQRTLADAGLLRKMLLPAAYNLVLAIIVLPIATRLLEAPRRASPGWQL